MNKNKNLVGLKKFLLITEIGQIVKISSNLDYINRSLLENFYSLIYTDSEINQQTLVDLIDHSHRFNDYVKKVKKISSKDLLTNDKELNSFLKVFLPSIKDFTEVKINLKNDLPNNQTIYDFIIFYEPFFMVLNDINIQLNKLKNTFTLDLGSNTHLLKDYPKMIKYLKHESSDKGSCSNVLIFCTKCNSLSVLIEKSSKNPSCSECGTHFSLKICKLTHCHTYYLANSKKDGFCPEHIVHDNDTSNLLKEFSNMIEDTSFNSFAMNLIYR